MIAAAFHTVIYLPLYNAVAYLIGVVPGEEVGLAVIILTIIVRIIIFPVAQRAVRTQIALRSAAPELEAIKKEFPDNKEEQARRTFALYKERDIHMFAPFLLLLIQLPLLLGLYWVFLRGGLPEIDPSLLYPFVKAPLHPNMQFLGLIDMSSHSIILAATAGLTQAAYAWLTVPKPPKEGSGFQHDLAHSMHLQMRYVLPAVIAIFGYSVAAAVALYWTTGNLFMIAQELVVRRSMRGKSPASPAAGSAVQAG
jgi:YidC/Oxa1 family membrane protein insertase